jgi:uncharacterized protein YoxC
MDMNEKLKDAVAKLKAVFTETKEETFMTVVKTSEGVELTLDTTEVVEGANVTIKDAEGIDVPAPEGEHVLEGGQVITVSGGKIVAVGEKMEEEEEEVAKPEDEVIQKMSAEIEAGKTAQADLLGRIAKLEELLNSKFERQDKIESKVSAMFDVVNAISGLPTEEPIEAEHKFSKADAKTTKREELANLMAKYKK